MTEFIGNAATYERQREEYQAHADRAREAGDDEAAARWQAHADTAHADRDATQRYESRRAASRSAFRRY